MKKLHYNTLLVKRRIEGIFIFPFILIGRLLSLLFSAKKEYDIYFLFPFYHIGGAEKVHAQVAQAFKGTNAIIYFTKKSHNDLFWKEFESTGFTIKDISKYTDNKWLYFLNLIFRGIITGGMNRQKNKPVVFNGQCNFAYKISPWVNKNIKQVELIHSLNSFSYIRTPFLPFISTTVMISRQRIKDHEVLYKQLQIPESFLKKIVYIPNAVKAPLITKHKTFSPFTVLYVGRGGVEKRLHLVSAIAEKVHSQNPAIRFEILGDVSGVLKQENFPFIHFYGNQNNPDVVSAIYEKASVLLLTSSTEGFPMVIIEAMLHEAVPVATPVGDIPYHIHPGKNGHLFSSIENEQKIIEEGSDLILSLSGNLSMLAGQSAAAAAYAKENFGMEQFSEAYRQVLNPTI